MTLCYLGLGSNLHSPKRMLKLAIKALRQIPRTSLIKLSPLYRSKPWGIHYFQPDYYNMVVKISTELSPSDLLSHCQRIEKQLGRVRGKKWGARSIDIDMLLFDNRTIHEPNLIVPHSRMLQRDFVLQPLLAIEPDITLPDGRLISSFFKMSDNCRLQT